MKKQDDPANRANRPPRWIGFIFPLAVLALAQIWAGSSDFHSDSLAAPSQIAVALIEGLRDGSILNATFETLAAAFGGLAIGIVIGVAVGALVGLVSTMDRLLLLPIELLRPIPVVALIPVVMLIFGLGFRMEVTLVAVATVWSMLLLTRSAIHGIEPRLIEVSRVLCLSPAAAAFKIMLPAILPRLFVAVRLSLGIALIVAVTVEIAANPIGIGFAMIRAVQSLHPETMFAFLIWLAFVGWALSRTLEAMEKMLPGARESSS